MAMRLKLVPILIAAGIGVVIALILSQFQLNVWVEQAPEINGPVVIAPDDLVPADHGPVPANPSGTPTVAPTPAPTVAPTLAANQPVPNGLRVKNLSNYPVRLVLLAKQPVAGATPSPSAQTPTIHWDFAPLEGSNSGLILSVPAGTLKLQPGDVLMAFALDGSRQYWGPFVVGQTALPSQKPNSSEWQLDLKPVP
jgi:hypothetical protein